MNNKLKDLVSNLKRIKKRKQINQELEQELIDSHNLLDQEFNKIIKKFSDNLEKNTQTMQKKLKNSKKIINSLTKDIKDNILNK